MKIKNYLRGMLAIALVASVLIPPVVFSAETGNQFPAARRGSHSNLEFFGVKVKRIEASATATHLVNGQGFLYGICAFGGLSGHYSIAYDTTFTVALGEPTEILDDNYSFAISPKVHVVNNTATLLAGGSGAGLCWEPSRPIKFVTGLYGKASDATHQTHYYVGCSTGTNPCTPGTD